MLFEKSAGTFQESAMSEYISTTVQDGIATVTLDRPEVLNALNPDMANDLKVTMGALAADETVRCVVIKGAGDHFMAGGDVRHFHELVKNAPDDVEKNIGAEIESVHAAIISIRGMPKPVIASIRGASAGFGMSLVAACDLAIAAEDSVFSLAYCRIGTSPDGGSTWTLPRMVGLKRAMELALLGDRITPQQASDYGLINWVVPTAELDGMTAELASRIAAGPVAALARTKALLNGSPSAELETQLEAEKRSFIAGVTGPEFAEGVSAFVEKRPARFP
jgi:2-(1,2-epoxy-1,2-dihydrophenyl)acetyl-CoA isomerase